MSAAGNIDVSIEHKRSDPAERDGAGHPNTCPGCGSHYRDDELAEHLRVCPQCGHHFPVRAPERIGQLADPGTFEEEDADLRSADPLEFFDLRPYVERLAEAVTLMKRLFTEEQVDHQGTHYSVQKAECRPKTIQQPHPPFLIAGGGPEILRLAGREADIVAIVPAGITGSGQLARESVTLETMSAQARIVREAAG